MIKYLSSYKDDVLRRKNEVIPGTYDPVFKSILTKCREYLAEVVHGITGIPKDEVLKGIIINSEFVVNNIEEKRKTSDLIIELKDNVINLEMNNKYYKYLNRRNNGYLYKIDTMTDKKTTIQINFNNFKSEDGQTIKKYTLKDENGKEEEGMSQGIEQGIKQGIKQGIERGIERGIEQGISSEKEKIAKNLLSMNMSIEDISKATGLSIDEIKNL